MCDDEAPPTTQWRLEIGASCIFIFTLVDEVSLRFDLILLPPLVVVTVLMGKSLQGISYSL